MLHDLKSDELINRLGGRFKLTALIQKRWKELMLGARPMVEPGKLTPLEIAVREIMDGKIAPGAPSQDKNEGASA
jgi:DNA-directed RNA polymerase subunit omega